MMKYLFVASVVFLISGCLFSSSADLPTIDAGQTDTDNTCTCPDVNGVGVCNSEGECAYVCIPGYLDCKEEEPGCETADGPDDDRCGCNVCEPGSQQTSSCDPNNECTYECSEGFLDCDSTRPGCETQSQRGEFLECSCGVICEMTNAFQNADLICTGGTCAAQCQSGWTDENGNYEDGCERRCMVSGMDDSPGNGFDEDCDGVDGIGMESFFIDLDAPSNGTGLTPDSPKNRFDVDAIRTSMRSVVLVRGNGSIGPIQDISSKVRFYGGYDQNWLSAGRSRITNTSHDQPALHVTNSIAKFHRFEFVANDISDEPPEYSRAVEIASGSNVEFFDTEIRSANVNLTFEAASDGAPGIAGNDGRTPTSLEGSNGAPINGRGGAGGAAGTCVPRSPPKRGDDGTGPNPGMGGAAGANACNTALVSDAESGRPGGRGAHGMQGQISNQPLVVDDDGNISRYRPELTEDADGEQGSGGGGGGGGGELLVEGSVTFTSGGASGGDGGTGGKGGSPGETGISTIGIILRDSSVIFNNSSLEMGTAGAGRAGGRGGCGGVGGEGGVFGDVEGIAGGDGGDGGPGGNGANGRPGNGGWSIGILLLSGAPPDRGGLSVTRPREEAADAGPQIPGARCATNSSTTDSGTAHAGQTQILYQRTP